MDSGSISMSANRTFNVVFVGDGHGAGTDPTSNPDKVIEYQGKSISVTQQ